MLGNNHVFCKVCRVDFSVGHGGKNYVNQHARSVKHKHAQEEHINCSFDYSRAGSKGTW